jgi:competence protein ComEA
MDNSPENVLSDKILPILEKHKLSLGLALLSLVLLGGGVIGKVLTQPKSSPVKIITSEKQDLKTDLTAKILIDVAGAVAIPGVYQLPTGSRVDLAIKVAGGLTEEVDWEYIARNINLVATLTDGAKIYIPRVGEETSAVSTQTTGLIKINTASSSELETLSGIGPKTAEKIINGRPYQTIDELLTRKIVGQSVFEKIKDEVSVY